MFGTPTKKLDSITVENPDEIIKKLDDVRNRQVPLNWFDV
jgi:hypothetical protein